MNNMIPDVGVAPNQEATQRARWYQPTYCSVCTSSIWLSPIALQEPPGAPEPRRSWVLCKSCHEALLIEMRRSPVRSALRLRIALGLVAAERSPIAYGRRTHSRDQQRIIGIAVLLFVAMILHLTIIVFLGSTLFK